MRTVADDMHIGAAEQSRRQADHERNQRDKTKGAGGKTVTY